LLPVPAGDVCVVYDECGRLRREGKAEAVGEAGGDERRSGAGPFGLVWLLLCFWLFSLPGRLVFGGNQCACLIDSEGENAQS